MFPNPIGAAPQSRIRNSALHASSCSIISCGVKHKWCSLMKGLLYCKSQKSIWTSFNKLWASWPLFTSVYSYLGLDVPHRMHSNHLVSLHTQQKTQFLMENYRVWNPFCSIQSQKSTIQHLKLPFPPRKLLSVFWKTVVILERLKLNLEVGNEG